MSYGNKEQPLSSRQISLLHVAKSRLGLEEADYRAALQLYGGAESAKQLTIGGFQRVMTDFQRMGFSAPAYFPAKSKGTVRNAAAVIEAQQSHKIKTLFADLGIDTAERQQGFCRRVIKKPWAQTRSDANKVIEGLKAMIGRKKVPK